MKVQPIALAELAHVNPPAPKLRADEQVSFLPMADASDEGGVTIQQFRSYSDVKTGYTGFKDGDVLVAKVTPCFENNKIVQAHLPTQFGFGSTEFHVLRPSDDLDPRFLLHFLRQGWVRHAGERRMTGSGGQRRVPKAFFETLPLPRFSLAEQRRIAAILDQADALRRLAHDTVLQFDRLIDAEYFRSFGDPVANPLGWPMSSLSEVLEEIEGGWSPTCLDRVVSGEEWGVLKLSAVTYGRFDPTANKALPVETSPKPHLEVKQGDILFTRKNTYDLVGASVLVTEAVHHLIIPDLIFRLKPKKNNPPILSAYLQVTLASKPMRSVIKSLASGAAGSMPNISKGRLENLRVPVPLMERQERYAAFCESHEENRKNKVFQAGRLEALFTSLQHRAFLGEI